MAGSMQVGFQLPRGKRRLAAPIRRFGAANSEAPAALQSQVVGVGMGRRLAAKRSPPG